MSAWVNKLAAPGRRRMPKSVLVLDFSGNYARDVVRCLVAAGRKQSHVLAPWNCPARHSRFVVFHNLSDSVEIDDYLMASVAQLRTNTRTHVLLPADEAAMAFVERNREALTVDWQLAPIPNAQALKIVTDKAEFSRHLAEYHLPHPRAELAANTEEALAAAAHVGYPLLLKPVRSPGGGVGIRRYENELQLHAALAAGVQRAPVLVQSFCRVRTRIAVFFAWMDRYWRTPCSVPRCRRHDLILRPKRCIWYTTMMRSTLLVA